MIAVWQKQSVNFCVLSKYKFLFDDDFCWEVTDIEMKLRYTDHIEDDNVKVQTFLL